MIAMKRVLPKILLLNTFLALRRKSLSVSFDGRKGSCSVNQDNEESLAYLLKTAEDIAKLAPVDPEFVPSEGKKGYPGS